MNETSTILLVLILIVWLLGSARFQAFKAVLSA